ncbi:MAG: glycosyltransferase [Candidatus Omnitrophica bacterium]|nr:glycosyltransferase [Candidatus Omnitrophota bacterium]
MKKIKILRIIARLNIGGPAIHVVLLNDGLDKTKYDSLLIYGDLSGKEGDMSYYALRKNIRAVFMPQLRRELNIFRDLSALGGIYWLLIQERPDIVHTHTAKAGALGRLACAGYNFLHPKKKIVLFHTFHGHVFEGYFNRLSSRLFIFIERFLAIFCAKIITVSESVKEEIVSLGIAKREKIEVIPLGFELDSFLNVPPKIRPAVNIGIVGRLVPIKNHRLFLTAASKMIKEDPCAEVRFHIIGDGELRQELERQCSLLGLKSAVDFSGWQKDLARVYQDLDIVALTSINEGTPVSLIEAMASARPVVATDIGGVRDLLGKEDAGKEKKGFRVFENGLLVKPSDAGGLAYALLFLAQNSALRIEMGGRGRDFVKTRFLKERLFEDIDKLYQSFLS